MPDALSRIFTIDEKKPVLDVGFFAVGPDLECFEGLLALAPSNRQSVAEVADGPVLFSEKVASSIEQFATEGFSDRAIFPRPGRYLAEVERSLLQSELVVTDGAASALAGARQFAGEHLLASASVERDGCHEMKKNMENAVKKNEEHAAVMGPLVFDKGSHCKKVNDSTNHRDRFIAAQEFILSKDGEQGCGSRIFRNCNFGAARFDSQTSSNEVLCRTLVATTGSIALAVDEDAGHSACWQVQLEICIFFGWLVRGLTTDLFRIHMALLLRPFDVSHPDVSCWPRRSRRFEHVTYHLFLRSAILSKDNGGTYTFMVFKQLQKTWMFTIKKQARVFTVGCHASDSEKEVGRAIRLVQQIVTTLIQLNRRTFDSRNHFCLFEFFDLEQWFVMSDSNLNCKAEFKYVINWMTALQNEERLMTKFATLCRCRGWQDCSAVFNVVKSFALQEYSSRRPRHMSEVSDDAADEIVHLVEDDEGKVDGVDSFDAINRDCWKGGISNAEGNGHDCRALRPIIAYWFSYKKSTCNTERELFQVAAAWKTSGKQLSNAALLDFTIVRKFAPKDASCLEIAKAVPSELAHQLNSGWIALFGRHFMTRKAKVAEAATAGKTDEAAKADKVVDVTTVARIRTCQMMKVLRIASKASRKCLTNVSCLGQNVETQQWKTKFMKCDETEAQKQCINNQKLVKSKIPQLERERRTG